MADKTVIKPTATAPAIDTSSWPLLLKVSERKERINKQVTFTNFFCLFELLEL